MRRLIKGQEEEDVREWKKLKTITMETEESWLYVDTDDDGNEFNVRELLIYIQNGDKQSQAWHKVWKKNAKNNSGVDGIIASWYGTISANKNMMMRITPDYNVGYDMEYGGQDVSNGHGGYQFTETDTPITEITIFHQSPLAIGSEIIVWGR